MTRPFKLLIVVPAILCLCGVWRTSAQLQEAWTARFTNASPAGLAVDSLGNVYVAGKGPVTIKYDAEGREQWVARFIESFSSESAIGMGLDREGAVYVAGNLPDPDGFLVVKYDSAGKTLWAAAYRGNGYDEARAMTVDSMGNVYVTGRSDRQGNCAGTCPDFATVKYDPSGKELWAARYHGEWREAVPLAIAVDSAGNVCVTGAGGNITGVGSEPGVDYATVKYDANGNQLWAARYDGPSDPGDSNYAWALTLGNEGSVYVTGNSGSDIATIKYDANGNRLWVARYTSGEGRAIAVDKTGNVIVLGSVGLIKYDSSGNQLWAAASDVGWQALALDDAGNAYVTGWQGNLLAESEWVTAKYGPDGIELATARYVPGRGFDLALDDLNNVYVTGRSPSGVVTIKYAQLQSAITQLASSTLTPDGQFQFTLIGEAGKTFEIQTSVDLVDWTTLTNLVSATGTNQITDSASSAQRFYRAVKLP